MTSIPSTSSTASPTGQPTLISGTFDDAETARGAFDRLGELHGVALLRLTGLVLVEVAKDGHLEMTTAPHDPAAPESEAAAAAFAQILGSLLATPLIGSKVGGTVDAVVDRIAENADTPERALRKNVASILKPGKWSVVGYANEVAESALRTELGDQASAFSFWHIDEHEEASLAEDAGVA
jgi:uncharacterized membrane protein